MATLTPKYPMGWKVNMFTPMSPTITEVNLSAFVHRLFHEDLSPILGIILFRELERNLHETVCEETQKKKFCNLCT